MSDLRRVRISSEMVAAYAMLNATHIADEVWKALPLEVRMQTWGDELYGSIPLKLPLEAPQEEVRLGDVAYWPPGHAICIFFGPTPASTGDAPRAASDVTVFGQIEGDSGVFRLVVSGAKLRFEQAGESAGPDELPRVHVGVEEHVRAQFDHEPVDGSEHNCPPEPKSMALGE